MRVLLPLFLISFVSFAQIQYGDYSQSKGSSPQVDSGQVELDPDIVSLTQLLQMSRIVVDGTVLSVSQPDSIISIGEVLHGELSSKRITFVQYWGGSEITKDPFVKKGERYILFLTPEEQKNPSVAKESLRYFATGIWIGKVKIENGKIRFADTAPEQFRIINGTDAGFFAEKIRHGFVPLRLR